MTVFQRLLDGIFKITEAHDLEESAYDGFIYMLDPYLEHMLDVLEKDAEDTAKYHVKEMATFVVRMNASIKDIKINSSAKLLKLREAMLRVLAKVAASYRKSNGQFRNKYSQWLMALLDENRVTLDNVFLCLEQIDKKHHVQFYFMADKLLSERSNRV